MTLGDCERTCRRVPVLWLASQCRAHCARHWTRRVTLRTPLRRVLRWPQRWSKYAVAHFARTVLGFDDADAGVLLGESMTGLVLSMVWDNRLHIPMPDRVHNWLSSGACTSLQYYTGTYRHPSYFGVPLGEEELPENQF